MEEDRIVVKSSGLMDFGQPEIVFTVDPATLLLTGDVLTMDCTRGFGDDFSPALQQIPRDTGLCFRTRPSPVADARLVWEPGQTSAAAISPPGSRGERFGIETPEGSFDVRFVLHKDPVR